jgi:diacylglycerol kinase (ATP)
MDGPFTTAAFRALVIANPKAGTASAALVDEVAALCRAHGLQIGVRYTTRRGGGTDALTAAMGELPGLVIAVGGDGTVCEVAAGLLALEANRRPALFAVPAGTGNSGYRMLWGRRPWREALAAVLRGDGAVVRRIDMARLVEADSPVLLGASSGLFAEALITAGSLAKQGWARYQEALAVTAARLDPFRGQVTVDGSVLYQGEIVLANVGGGRYRAGQYQLLPHSLVDDGLLDVCVIGADLSAARVQELTRDGRHLDRPGVAYGRGRRIVVERLDGAALCYEHDGEVQPGAGRTMTVEVRPYALPIWGARITECASAA